MLFQLKHSLHEAVINLPETLKDLKEELDHTLTDAIKKIDDWKGHIIRCVNQDRLHIYFFTATTSIRYIQPM